jgi:hypothetical protein
MIAHDGKSAAKSVTLARRISTGQPQEMQKNRRWSLAVGEWPLASKGCSIAELFMESER